jgi:hypothetical protein
MRATRPAKGVAFAGLVHWKKVACGAFFKPVASLPPAKGVTFAGCRV